MPIQLRTGLPGAGKTLGVVEYLIEVREKEPHRPVRVLGIADLRGDLSTPLSEDEFRRWHELPAGTIVVVDEVQKYLPVRRAGDPPAWISKLSEHRHLGLDFLFVTQHPALIDTYVRRLVDKHVHHVRKYGTHIVERLVWPEVQMELTSKSAAKACERKSKHVFSKQAMESYTSSELHTVKRSIPPFLKVALALLFVVPVLGLIGWRVMAHLGRSESTSASSVHTESSKLSGGFASGATDKVVTPEDWQRRMTPRVRGVPWSAPIFDGQAVTTVPDLRCILIEREDHSRDCRCYSEQDTRLDVDQKECFVAATDGVYNPFRPALQTAKGVADKRDRSAPASASSAARAVSADAEVVEQGWKQSPMQAAYLPPELAPHPVYTPHALR